LYVAAPEGDGGGAPAVDGGDRAGGRWREHAGVHPIDAPSSSSASVLLTEISHDAATLRAPARRHPGYCDQFSLANPESWIEGVTGSSRCRKGAGRHQNPCDAGEPLGAAGHRDGQEWVADGEDGGAAEREGRAGEVGAE
jgi:hypothetical protein